MKKGKRLQWWAMLVVYLGIFLSVFAGVVLGFALQSVAWGIVAAVVGEIAFFIFGLCLYLFSEG